MPSFADFTQAELEQGPNLQILLDAKRSLVDLNPSNFGMLVETGDYAGFKIEVTGSGFVYHGGEPLLGEFSKIEVFDSVGRSFLTYRWTDASGDLVSSGQSVSVLWAGTSVDLTVDEFRGADGAEVLTNIRANTLIDLAGGDDSLATSWAPIILGGDGNDSFSNIGTAYSPVVVIYGEAGNDSFAQVRGDIHGGAGEDLIAIVRAGGYSNQPTSRAWGGDGADVISGGFAAAYGDNGNDIFIPGLTGLSDGFRAIAALVDGGADDDTIVLEDTGSFIRYDGERRLSGYYIDPQNIETIVLEEVREYSQILRFVGADGNHYGDDLRTIYLIPDNTIHFTTSGDFREELELTVSLDSLAQDVDYSGWSFSSLDVAVTWNLNGSVANRHIKTSSENDAVYGSFFSLPGTVLSTGNGNDVVYVKAETIDLGDGDDRVFVSASSDDMTNIRGGNGSDTLVYSFSRSEPAFGLVVDLEAQNGSGVSMISIENVVTGAGNDRIQGSVGNNFIDSGRGDDTVDGGDGFDTIAIHYRGDILLTDNGLGVVRDGGGNILQRFENFEAVSTTETRRTLNSGDRFFGNALDNGFTAKKYDEVHGGEGHDWVSFNFDFSSSVFSFAAADYILLEGVITDPEGFRIFSGQKIKIYDDVEEFRFKDVTLVYDEILHLGRGPDIYGTIADDALYGTTQAEGISGAYGDDTLFGDAGADTLWGDEKEDELYGGDGDDTLYGGRDSDTLDGGAGDDLLVGGEQQNPQSDAKNNVYISAEGNDTLIGGLGYDLVIFSGRASGVTLNLATSTATSGEEMLSLTGIDNVVGSAFGDVLAGDDDNNIFTGGTGDDLLIGGAGTDTVRFNVALASVSGRLEGSNLVLQSFEGRDSVRDDVEVLAFTDVKLSWAEALAHFFSGVSGTDAAENVNGTDASELINAGAGGDWITPGAGSDTIDGGSGNDMISFVTLAETPSRTNVQYRLDLDLTEGTAITSGKDVYTISNVERVTGTIFADRIKGDAGDNELRGLGDFDWFTATTGNDTMDGGTGNDMISYVDWQSDAVNTADPFNPGGAPPPNGEVTGVVVDLNDPSNNTNLAAGHEYVSIERVTGSGRQDVFYGDENENDFRGLGDFDWFVGSTGGRERYFGGDGSDTVTYYNSISGVSASLRNGARVGGEETGRGTAGDAALDLYFSIENLVGTNFADTLTGSEQRNNLNGLAGDDFIFGYGGTDYLKGGTGNDVIDGGAGSDFAVLDGNFADYGISRISRTEVNTNGADGFDRFTNVENFAFDDQTISIFDLAIV